MTDSFVQKIRNNKIAQPTKMNFDLKKWERAWLEVESDNEKDINTYEAGKIFYEILEEIRGELRAHYEQVPNIDDDALIKMFVATSNRNRSIISKKVIDNLGGVQSIHSMKINAGEFPNQLTLDEISDGSVDGFAKAIEFAIKRLRGKKYDKSKRLVKVDIDFPLKESYLSQIYGVFEGYWQAIVWGDYKLRYLESSDSYEIYQECTDYEVERVFSRIRKSRLSAQLSALLLRNNFDGAFDHDNYVVVIRDGKRKKVVNRKISDSGHKVRHFNRLWRTEELFLDDQLPLDLLNKKTAYGFSVSEALNVYRCLMLLSHQYADSYPDNDAVSNINDLMRFCPKIGRLELIRGISFATGYEFPSVVKIMDFIEYKAEDDQDLWCHPIIQDCNGEYVFMTSALLTPVMLRIVEHWLVKMGEVLQDKGQVYERTVIEGLYDALSDNPLIEDYDKPISRRIKIKSGEEEIDLLARIGDTIIIGEAKSIVTTDSAISQYRTYEILRRAADQVNRKSEFLRDNLAEIFNKLDWHYDSNKKYNIINLVINSGRMFVGSSIGNVPVCDEKILIKYFEDGFLPYFSDLDKVKGIEHLAWFTLYKNQKEAETNLFQYLSYPPQCEIDKFDYETSCLIIPSINKYSHRMAYCRLLQKDISMFERMHKKHAFPLETMPDIEERLRKVTVSI